jgi:hypothetical protein
MVMKSFLGRYSAYGRRLFWRLVTETPVSRLTGLVLAPFWDAYWGFHSDSPANESNAIGVLGRGDSLRKVPYLSFLGQFIIVNSFNEELQMDAVYSTLKNARIIHMINSEEPVLHPKYLLSLDIAWYQFNRLAPNGESVRWREPRTKRRPEALGLEFEYLPEDFEKFMADQLPPRVAKELPEESGEHPYPGNTGLIAVLYAASSLNKDHIYVADIDFYERDYLSLDLDEKFDDARLSAHKKAGQRMKVVFTDIARRFPETEFHVITHSSYDPDLPNVTVYTTEQELEALPKPE